MLAAERYKLIRKKLEENGAVSNEELIKAFQMSDETVRRDLIKMEKSGFCTRVHGGAVRNGEFVQSSIISYRSGKNEQLKIELAKKAVKFVREGDIISIDSGSTTAAFSEELKENFSNLTIVTYSLSVFEILKKRFKVILCGGLYDDNENAFYGSVAISEMLSLHTQKAFLAPSAISIKAGIRDYQGDLILVQKAMYDNSDKVFFLADSSKFERNALYKIADIKREHVFISDNSLSSDIKKIYSDNGIKIY
ncbi:MAG: DeoR/GlpR transcriptional regulator [Clostridia bacterium]|nr:DeoR/GlpR transcriptional regulator [Clostridia bacterium]